MGRNGRIVGLTVGFKKSGNSGSSVVGLKCKARYVNSSKIGYGIISFINF